MHTTRKEMKADLEITKEPIIIGDGPIGLAIALVLAMHKPKIKVQLVGSHLDDFTRSNEIGKNIFDKINEIIFPLKISVTDPNHLKDGERQLYELGKKEGVIFHKKVFIGFDKNKQILIANKGSTKEKFAGLEVLHSGLLIDCTGTCRAVLKEYEKDIGAKHFIFLTTEEYPEPIPYAKMRTIMPDGQVEFFSHTEFKKVIESDQEFNPIAFTLAFESLREQGWDSYIVPESYFSTSMKKNSELLKTALFFKLPFKRLGPLAENDHDYAINYASILLKLFNNTMDDFQITLQSESKKHLNKPTWFIFTEQPTYTLTPFARGDKNYPFIIHFGDSSANFPFSTGNSIYEGLHRFQECFKEFEFKEDNIIIDCHKLKMKYESMIQSFKEILKKHHEDQINDTVILWNDNFVRHIYKRALEECKDKDEITKIQKGLAFLEKKISNHFSRLQYKSITAEEIKDINLTKKKLSAMDDIVFKHIIPGKEFLEPNELKLQVKICETMTISYLHLARKCVADKKWTLANESYLLALEYCYYVPKRPHAKLKVFHEFLKLKNKMLNYDQMDEIIEAVNNIISTIDLENISNKKLVDRVNIFIIKADLYRLNQYLEQKPLATSRIRNTMITLSKTIDSLSTVENTFNDDLKALEAKFMILAKNPKKIPEPSVPTFNKTPQGK